jgi:hypothetical protein
MMITPSVMMMIVYTMFNAGNFHKKATYKATLLGYTVFSLKYNRQELYLK